jgi:multiple sugar transport system permease protein
MALPFYFIALAALSSRRELNRFPLSLVPRELSLDTLSLYLQSTGVIGGLVNSVTVGLTTTALSLVLGVPAGYALARQRFRGASAYQLFLLLTRALPIVVLSVPLATVFLSIGLYDTPIGVAFLHTALTLPTTVLITAAIFVAVPREHEEAAMIFGASRLQAFFRVVAPQALPGIVAAAMFAFVMSWNEVLGAAVLTFDQRTLTAQVLSSLNDSPLPYRHAGGLLLVLPAVLFIAVMRRYLTNMWGTTLR